MFGFYLNLPYRLFNDSDCIEKSSESFMEQCVHQCCWECQRLFIL